MPNNFSKKYFSYACYFKAINCYIAIYEVIMSRAIL